MCSERIKLQGSLLHWNMAGGLGKKGMLNGDIYRNVLKKSLAFSFLFNPLQPLALMLIPSCNETLIPFLLFVSQIWKPAWDARGKLPTQLGSGTAACLFGRVRTLVLCWASVLVPTL